MRLNRFTSLASLAALLLVVSILPAGAQSLEEIREERERVQAEEAAKASEVNAQSADLNELNNALEILQANVNTQEGKVADAERRLDEAEAEVEEANRRVAELEALRDTLRDQAAQQAIGSFVSGANGPSAFINSDDINEAVWMQRLMETVTERDADAIDQLRATDEDIAIEQKLAVDAEAEAEIQRNELAAALAELQTQRDAQANLAAQAEDRLDHLLSEQASLQEAGAELAEAEKAELERLAELARKAAAAAPRGPGGTYSVPNPGDIVNVRGFNVHSSIADNVAAMIDAASAAGHSFGGGGYRSSASQIALRKAHCGSSNYAIYEMPSSQCSPPTARPGRSNHERGLALDLTCSGSLITSRSSSCFQWLAANAASYGFYNLPSEPWHWSVNGN